MPGECYLCDANYQAIPGQRRGDALGTCGSCSVLSCGAHAARDPNYPRWVCVICDATLLAASAASSSPRATAGLTIGRLVTASLLHPNGPYARLADFFESRPEMRWVANRLEEILAEAPRRFVTDVTEPFWFGLSEEGRRLMAAAIIIVLELEVGGDDLIELLRVLVEEWRGYERGI